MPQTTTLADQKRRSLVLYAPNGNYCHRRDCPRGKTTIGDLCREAIERFELPRNVTFRVRDERSGRQLYHNQTFDSLFDKSEREIVLGVYPDPKLG